MPQGTTWIAHLSSRLADAVWEGMLCIGAKVRGELLMAVKAKECIIIWPGNLGSVLWWCALSCNRASDVCHHPDAEPAAIQFDGGCLDPCFQRQQVL